MGDQLRDSRISPEADCLRICTTTSRSSCDGADMKTFTNYFPHSFVYCVDTNLKSDESVRECPSCEAVATVSGLDKLRVFVAAS